MARTCSPGGTGNRKSTAAAVIWESMLAGLGRAEAADGLGARLREPVVWPDILAESRRLRVTPLFYAGLQAAAAVVPPPRWSRRDV